MQTLTRRPTQSLCIFCALRTSAALFTTATAPAQTERFREKPRKFRRQDGSRDGFVDTTGRAKKFDLTADDAPSPRRFRKQQAPEHDDPREPVRFDQNADRRVGHSSFKIRGSDLARKGQPKKHADDKIRKSLNDLKSTCAKDKILARLKLHNDDLRARFADFADGVSEDLDHAGNDDPLLMKLRDSAGRDNTQRLERDMVMAFFSHALMSRFSHADLQQQARQANLQYPSEWFPATRGRQREIHLHVGPTNSGKTYQALKRLEQAERGLYAGPLRLLAHEVYMRLNASGKRCNLVTGDERKTADTDAKAPMTSCTVEMVPLNSYMDVAVIDEIQVIGSEDRGWAWTQALLGVQAAEVHLCGEERAVPIIKELVALCGEKLHIHRYERLSPLKVANRSLDGNIRNLQKGDCIVCFSVMAIHGLRQLIEKTLQCSVAVIYGSLPPETRAQQARLFNDPNNDYDILVASDAVGMGLNLSIKRMIFQSSYKIHGGQFSELFVHEVKQIAGRAGRYSTAEADMKKTPEKAAVTSVGETPVTNNIPEPVSPALAPQKQLGLVTSLEKLDYPAINRLMNSEALPITTAGLLPPSYLIERFVRYFPMGTPFSFLLNRLHDIATTNSRFHLCDLRQQTAIADAIEDVEELSTADRIVFVSSPADMRKPGEAELINTYARMVAEGRGINIVEVPGLDLDLLDESFTADRAYLSKIEKLHKSIVIWMWLSYRFKSIFIERDLALHVKALTESRIEDTLAKLSFDFQKMRKQREKAIMDLLRREQKEDAAAAAEVALVPEASVEEEQEDVAISRRELVEDAENASSGVPMDHVAFPDMAAVSDFHPPSLSFLVKPPIIPLALGSPDGEAVESLRSDAALS